MSMLMQRKLIAALVGLVLLLTCFSANARLPRYFYSVGNWYSNASATYQQNAASLLAHQYPDAYSAVADGWLAHVPQCANGGGPMYVLETVEPVAVGGYADGDIYEAYYKSLWSANCGEPSISHVLYDSAQLYVSCGGQDVSAHNAYGPDDCLNLPINAEKNRGMPPADCPCSGGEESSNTPASDPVNPGTGNKFDTLTLYVGAGPFPLDLTMSFNSMTGVSEALNRSQQIVGRQRILSYMRHLGVSRHNADATAYVLRADGKTYTFNLIGTDWVGEGDIPDKLIPTYDPLGSITAWTYYDGNGDVERYDSSGNLYSIQHDGWMQALTYDGAGRLAQVTDPSGRTLAFIYNAFGTVQAIQTPDGSVSLTYDGAENVSRVTWPDGTHRDYVYAEHSFGNNLLPHNLTGVIDESGMRVDNTTYDDNEHALADFGSAGTGMTKFVYGSSPDGHARTTITHPLGSTEQVDYTSVLGVPHAIQRMVSCAGCTTQTTKYTYDAHGRMASRTDPNGSVTLTTYDASGLLLTKVEASGTAIARTTERVWDNVSRKPLRTTTSTADGTVIRIQSQAYNDRGLVTARCVIDPVIAADYACSAAGAVPAGVRRTVTSYCTTVSVNCPMPGLALKTDGPRTDVADEVTYAWYAQLDDSGCGVAGGPCHHPGDLATSTDGAGLVTTYVSYDRAGRPSRIKMPNGTVVDSGYTPRGWLATKTFRANADGSASPHDATTTLSYNPDGTVHQVVDPDGVAVIFTYDAAHRLTDTTDSAGNRLHYTLDASGNRIKEETLTVDGVVVKSTTTAFNALGQLIALTDGMGHEVFSASDTDSYDASGNLVHTRDALGIQQKRAFDGLNRLITTIQNYQGSEVSTSGAQSVTTYDALDRVSGFSDPDGLNTTYVHDAFGNTLATHSPDTGSTARTFDMAGNTLTSTDALNNTRTMAYDADNRPLAVSFTDASLDIQYKYDEADAVTGCTGNYGAGRRTRIIEANGGITWCYDGRGNVVKKTQMVGAIARTTTYTWTPGNRLSSLTTPNGTVIAYTRDALGQITAVSATPQGGIAKTVVSNVTYQPFGPIASLISGNGQAVTYAYDQTGALTDISGGAFNQHMRRDAMGNITAIGNSAGVPAPTETYGYDALYRLTGVKDASGDAIEAYTYSKVGDRLTKSGAGILTGAYSYEPGTHHLTSVGTTARVVDARGNTTSNVLASGTYGYGYNQRNRMVVLQKDGATEATYRLNALGQRVQKAVGGVSTTFDYDENSQLTSETSGINQRDYIWLDGTPIGIVDTNGTTPSVTFVSSDGLGTPRAVSDASGALLWQWSYTGNPFGESEPASSDGYVLNLRYPGQYFDAESGLNYNVNRDYEAATGRYIQSDPIGLRAGTTTYSYVTGSPLAHTDPLGTQIVIPVRRPVVAPPLPYDGTPPASSLPNWGPTTPVWACIGPYCVPTNIPAGLSDYADWMSHHSTPKPGSKPKNCPGGTKPIDQTGLSKDDVHDIKDGVGAGPQDWTGIAPNGDVITGDHEGNAVNHGNYGDYTQ
ncbi:MAG: RHS repeat-associated core domain-containing protein [Luteibacter sp.]